MAASELPINTGASASDMAQLIFGAGVSVQGASYTGDSRSSGTYSNGDSVSGAATPGDTGVILSTGRAQDFTNSSGQENQNSNTTTNTSGQNNNSQFNAAAGSRTYDAAYLDVDFIPTGNVMTMQFIFASEEYPEYTSSIYQDFVGVWINGSQVDLGIGNGDTDPGNINSGSNENLFVDNTGDDHNTEMDGFTVTLTLTIPVLDGQLNSIRIGIADVSDSSYDSNLLIAGNSVQTSLLATDDDLELYPNASKVVDVLGNDTYSVGSSLVITHVNGVPVSVWDTVTLATGATVQLNDVGQLIVTGDGDVEDYNFTYQISDGTNTDTGFVNVSQVPCFVAGTMIATPDGAVAVENLSPGDLVLTRDEGPQPLRWTGQRTVSARGDFAPIRIRRNTFGHHGELLISPLHRVLIKDILSELLFGEDEVLVAAKDLLNGVSVRRCPVEEVTYLHLLFDRHQVIYAEGLPTESFLPGPQTANSFEADIVAEIVAIFPELDPETGKGYGPAARRNLRRFEAELLLSQMAA